MTSDLRARMFAPEANRIEDQLVLRPGRVKDYAALCEHHYRSHRPATITRVLTLEHHRPTVVGRYLGTDDASQIVGVLVESLAAMHCRLRDHATGHRFTTVRDLPGRAKLLNEELRCISRVIVHPQWRGLGLAVRLVRASLDDPQTIYTESLAAMGRVHPFFERAGMTAYLRQPHPFDARLIDALACVGITLLDLACVGKVSAVIARLPQARAVWIRRELRRWYCRAIRTSRVDHIDETAQLLAAQRRLSCEPVYYLSDNRDVLKRNSDADA